MLAEIRRLFDYDTWANDRMLDSVRSVAEPGTKLLGLVAHVYSSKRMWLGRIQKSEDASVSTWPELTLEQSVDLEQQMRRVWDEYITSLTQDELARTVHYTIKDVGPGQQTVSDILMHKFLHAAYHRGQIATLVRAEGGTPASTDMVVYAKARREAGA